METKNSPKNENPAIAEARIRGALNGFMDGLHGAEVQSCIRYSKSQDPTFLAYREEYFDGYVRGVRKMMETTK